MTGQLISQCLNEVPFMFVDANTICKSGQGILALWSDCACKRTPMWIIVLIAFFAFIVQLKLGPNAFSFEITESVCAHIQTNSSKHQLNLESVCFLCRTYRKDLVKNDLNLNV